MMNTVLVQRVTCYVNSNSAQKAKNVCRVLTGKGDNYPQLFLKNVDPQPLQRAKRGIASCLDCKLTSTKT